MDGAPDERRFAVRASCAELCRPRHDAGSTSRQRLKLPHYAVASAACEDGSDLSPVL